MGYSSGRKSSRLKEPLSNGDYRKMTVKKGGGEERKKENDDNNGNKDECTY